MKQYLSATIQALSKSELDDILDPYWVSGIKQRDPDPEVRVYSVGHEGEANLHLPGIGGKTFTWIQAAVRWVADKLRLGTPVFDRHDPTTNSHTGRTQIGEIVGKAVRQIGDRMNTLAAVYIYPQYKSRPLDIASIEAEIEYAHDGSQAWPTAIKNVSGVALSTSEIDTPGFPGATLLGAVQAYVQAFGGDLKEKKTMNLSDVKAAVRELNLIPSQVFDVETIIGDAKVAEKAKETYKDTLNANERLTRERDEARNKIAALENANAESTKKLQQFQMQSKGATVIDSILTERKLGDGAKTFIKRNLHNFTTEATDEEQLKADLSKFVDTANSEYQELARDVFGVKTDTEQEGNNDSQFRIPKEFTTAADPAKPTEGGTHEEMVIDRSTRLRAEMDPNQNPLIPGGKAAQEALRT